MNLDPNIPMAIYEFPPEVAFPRLRELRSLMLRLHKSLLDSERTTYEQVHGRIAHNGEFFQLVIGHEWFAWLRPMSQFIAKIDEAVSAKEPMTLGAAKELLTEAQHLLAPDEQGLPPAQRYYQAIQRDPNIALMHAEVMGLFRL